LSLNPRWFSNSLQILETSWSCSSSFNALPIVGAVSEPSNRFQSPTVPLIAKHSLGSEGSIANFNAKRRWIK
jgi:hypothetical protein